MKIKIVISLSIDHYLKLIINIVFKADPYKQVFYKYKPFQIVLVIVFEDSTNINYLHY